MRCGPAPPVSLKLNFPLLSALVLAAISMPVVRLMRMTSSPTAGLPVVPLVTVPERVWARAEAKVSARTHRARIAASKAGLASLVKKLLAVADLFLETAALGNQRFIGLVIADPEPQISIRPSDRRARWFSVIRADHISWP